MSGPTVSVASAVLPPEPQHVAGTPSPSLKRRRSSDSTPEHKRRRISQDESSKNDREPAGSPTQPDKTNPVNERRKTGQLEERKRGQRLFGALLGTLSQSSSSTANKRRTDIENKQRTKLKAQTEEENERRKARLEDLLSVRRRQQKTFDQQSVRRRHQDLLSRAHFLQTKAEPKLYYKPWELLSHEQATINYQIEKAHELVDNEVRDLNISQVRIENEDNQVDASEADLPDVRAGAEGEGTNGKAADSTPSVDAGVNGTNKHDFPVEEASNETPSSQKLKENQDDGGEVVEGEEDTVIY